MKNSDQCTVNSNQKKQGKLSSLLVTKHWPLITPRGYFVILTLVFAAVFLTLISALAGYIFVEKRIQLAKENREKALHIAEAGLEYYRWHLAHYPDDLEDGTGIPGPYEHEVPDPEGGALGAFSLNIEGDYFCGEPTSVVIESTGWTDADPTYKRIVSARYTRPSVAKYSHIVNSNVWAGSDRVISGPYHSNGGVRMDGTHNADVSSGVDTWLCTSTFGCSPSQYVGGVFGAGSNPELWKFPVPAIDFNGITVDLLQLQGYATSSGIYLPPSGSGKYGWRITFNADGTMLAQKVVGTIQVWGYTTENGWAKERTVMSNTESGTTYTVDPDCPVVFVEDNVWLEGVVSGKVTIAAADVDTSGVDYSIYLNSNVTYANVEGDGLTAIGEKDVLVGLQTPDIMDLNGIFIAQKGRFGRNHYVTSGSYGLPSSLDPYVKRSILTTNGTVVSNGRVGTKWTSGGVFVSGYAQRYDSYDADLAASPPPFTPATSDDYEFIEWREQN